MMTLAMQPQPDDTTCGPTSLHAVYQYLGLDLTLDDVLANVHYLADGGTLAVYLGLDALRRGLEVELVSYNLHLFDPTWAGLSSDALLDRLDAQLAFKGDTPKLVTSTRAYQQFLAAGGRLRFDDLTPRLLWHYLDRDLPVLTGLSATYLYNTSREYTKDDNQSVHDDLRGAPVGHFVVLTGYEGDRVLVADPYQHNPLARDHYYRVEERRLLNAILLGVITYDANLLVVAPPGQL